MCAPERLLFFREKVLRFAFLKTVPIIQEKLRGADFTTLSYPALRRERNMARIYWKLGSLQRNDPTASSNSSCAATQSDVPVV